MIFPPDFDKICQRAVDAFGIPSQEAMLIGEVGELLTLYGRRAQGRDDPQQWIDEIADILIMAHQLAYIHGKDAVEARMVEKMPKLLQRIERREAACSP